MIIHLRSTSNLLNKNINWKFLADFSKLKFSEYGEIFSLKNINKNKSIEINLVFLNDILNINNNDYSVEVKKIEKLLKKLKHKLIHDPNPVIVGVSAFSYINEVEAAQTLQKEQSIKNLFLNELYKLTKKNKKTLYFGYRLNFCYSWLRKNVLIIEIIIFLDVGFQV